MINKIKPTRSEKIIFIFILTLATFTITSFFLLIKFVIFVCFGFALPSIFCGTPNLPCSKKSASVRLNVFFKRFSFFVSNLLTFLSLIL